MDNLQLKQVPITKTGMLVRKPVADVFEAFVNPDITTKFWFTKSSGRLEADKHVQWDWEMYGISIAVTAKAIEPNKRIVIEWPDPVVPPPWNGCSHPKRMAQRSSVSRKPDSLATGTNL
jgi:uncharacterized protein YndB with AHSA1/START domain